jgi:hypothetical protein
MKLLDKYEASIRAGKRQGNWSVPQASAGTDAAAIDPVVTGVRGTVRTTLAAFGTSAVPWTIPAAMEETNCTGQKTDRCMSEVADDTVTKAPTQISCLTGQRSCRCRTS